MLSPLCDASSYESQGLTDDPCASPDRSSSTPSSATSRSAEAAPSRGMQIILHIVQWIFYGISLVFFLAALPLLLVVHWLIFKTPPSELFSRFFLLHWLQDTSTADYNRQQLQLETEQHQKQIQQYKERIAKWKAVEAMSPTDIRSYIDEKIAYWERQEGKNTGLSTEAHGKSLAKITRKLDEWRALRQKPIVAHAQGRQKKWQETIDRFQNTVPRFKNIDIFRTEPLTGKLNGVVVYHPQQSQNPSNDQKWVIHFLGLGSLYENEYSHIKDELCIRLERNVLCMNARQMGLTDGRVQRDQDLIDDGIQQVRYLLGQGVQSNNIILSGHSLGAAIASAVALDLQEHKEHPVTIEALINDRSFAHYPKMVQFLSKLPLVRYEDRYLYPIPVLTMLFKWCAMRWWGKLDAVNNLLKLQCPIVVITATGDPIIPSHLNTYAGLCTADPNFFKKHQDRIVHLREDIQYTGPPLSIMMEKAHNHTAPYPYTKVREELKRIT